MKAELGEKDSIVFNELSIGKAHADLAMFNGVSKVFEIKTIFDDYLKFPEKTIVIHNGVVLQKIKKAIPYSKPKLHPQIESSDFLLLQISGFRPQKDQGTLIKALSLLPDNCKLILVGDGERKSELEHLVKSLNLGERAFFLGQRMDVPQLLKSVDTVVLSSHHEGLSLASIEGMASGKPFIASDVPGLTEVVRGAGLLFPQGDENQLAKVISDLLQNPEKRNEIAKLGMKRAEDYSIEKMVSKHIELYHSVYNL